MSRPCPGDAAQTPAPEHLGRLPQNGAVGLQGAGEGCVDTAAGYPGRCQEGVLWSSLRTPVPPLPRCPSTPIRPISSCAT